ncbi:MAG: RHS repeat-associated core domain-containing protein, partial [Lysobacterales bacterium]
MYDPVLGRFIQADSIVQDPFDPQSLNRYAYVLNNPLSATDPSGNISFKNALKLGVAIGIAVYSGGTASHLLLTGAINGFQAVAIVAVGGALSGAVSGGGFKGALRGAFTAAVFFGVGQGASALEGATGKFGAAAFANNGLGRAALHGIAGGALAELQGGNFGHGFLTAGVGKAVTSRVALTGNDLADGAIAALVGGTLSEASGDSFTNGALTGAMQFAFNQLVDKGSRTGRFNRARRALRELQSTLDRTNPFSSEQEAAEAFCFSGGCKIAEKYGFEVGANIEEFGSSPSTFKLTDFTIGTEANIAIPGAIGIGVADVHVHPITGLDGLSGYAQSLNRSIIGGRDDLGINVDRRINGFAFRGGDRAAFRFDFNAFDRASQTANAGQVIDAR